MHWLRHEQAALVVAIVALLIGGAVLLVVRRPPPPVRLIEPQPVTEIVVQIDGAVMRPGVYRLPPGTRVSDALRAAGGPTASADLDALNGARVLHDGERLDIPGRAALTPGAASAVNINTATAGDLESLPGIGPVLAARIIDHRARHGPFRALEDLLRVQGIGPGLLSRLRGKVQF